MLEDASDYEAFEANVIADYNAELAVERELVLRLASVLWRLRRATAIETALFESVTGHPCNSSPKVCNPNHPDFAKDLSIIVDKITHASLAKPLYLNHS